MYIIRDIFYLHFGKFKEASTLLHEASSRGLLPDAKSARVLSDFTGASYRLIFEEGYDSLEEYERSLAESMNKVSWKKWYSKFSLLVNRSEREILRILS
jgi:hypothetical protein